MVNFLQSHLQKNLDCRNVRKKKKRLVKQILARNELINTDTTKASAIVLGKID